MKSQTDAVSKPSAAATRAAKRICKTEVHTDTIMEQLTEIIDAEFKDVVQALKNIRDEIPAKPTLPLVWKIKELVDAALSRTEGGE